MRNQVKHLPQTKPDRNLFARLGFNLMTILIVALSPILPHPTAAMTVLPEGASLPAMSQISLKSVRRVLVVAPHPDDETIAPGGLIQEALANGSQVKVVIVTNGDGQFMAPAIFGMEDALTPAGYVSMGERRQAESLKALKQLGVPAENIIFLGYPDRGIEPMLNSNWTEAQSYTAPFTRMSQSPYSYTYSPETIYCGISLFTDLETILSNFQPDLVVLPHPADQHADHRATSIFTSRAVAALHANNAAFQPQLWAYLVHYNNYPASSTSNPSEGFLPPSDLRGGNNSWGNLNLTPDQESNKNTAIHDYPTQTFLLGSFLSGFSTTNEIFMLLPLQDSAAEVAVTTGSETLTFNSAGMLP